MLLAKESPAMKRYVPLKDPCSVLSILSNISILGGVSDAQRKEIFRRLETGRFEKGECVSQHGEEASHLYIIAKGKIDLLLTDNKVVVWKRAFHVGDCFGEAAFLAMNNDTASFVAAENCEILALSRHSLNQLRHEDPELFTTLIMNLARELARKLQYTDSILLQLERDRGT
jgi:CRP/FNR family transcriptional regulator, cyclic AMP receptor protein